MTGHSLQRTLAPYEVSQSYIAEFQTNKGGVRETLWAVPEPAFPGDSGCCLCLDQPQHLGETTPLVQLLSMGGQPLTELANQRF